MKKFIALETRQIFKANLIRNILIRRKLMMVVSRHFCENMFRALASSGFWHAACRSFNCSSPNCSKFKRHFFSNGYNKYVSLIKLSLEIVHLIITARKNSFPITIEILQIVKTKSPIIQSLSYRFRSFKKVLFKQRGETNTELMRETN